MKQSENEPTSSDQDLFALSLDDMREAVRLTAGRAKLEASSGINDTTLRKVAETGVEYILTGTSTKNVKAVDLSMRLKFEGHGFVGARLPAMHFVSHRG